MINTSIMEGLDGGMETSREKGMVMVLGEQGTVYIFLCSERNGMVLSFSWTALRIDGGYEAHQSALHSMAGMVCFPGPAQFQQSIVWWPYLKFEVQMHQCVTDRGKISPPFLSL